MSTVLAVGPGVLGNKFKFSRQLTVLKLEANHEKAKSREIDDKNYLALIFNVFKLSKLWPVRYTMKLWSVFDQF